MSEFNAKKISDPTTLYCGENWAATIPLTSKSGAVTISAVTATMYAEESTSDILSTYSSSSVTFTGNNIVTPLVGINGSTIILPGKYKFFILCTYNGGLKTYLYQDLEFLELKG